MSFAKSHSSCYELNFLIFNFILGIGQEYLEDHLELPLPESVSLLILNLLTMF